MSTAAKLFTIGGSQAVRLPADYRFDGAEVFIRRDPATGDMILSRKPHGSWQKFFELAERAGVPADFMDDRNDVSAEERNLS
jgi:antitoxin VapB